MKSISPFLILAFLFSVTACAPSKLIKEKQFGENQGNLKMYVYAPTIIEKSEKKRALIVALHGCSQTSKELALVSGWNKLADENNLVILYPNQKRINNVSKCFNWFELKDITKNSGELQSIINMVDHTINAYNIDTSQVFIYGLSAGAAMGVALLAVHPSYFKAGAIFAGTPYKVATNKIEAVKLVFGTNDKTPLEWGKLVSNDSIEHSYPDLFVYHGTKDRIVNIKNSNELIDQWSYLHKIDALPDSSTTNYESAPLDRIAYTNSEGTEKIVFYKFYGMGHALPVDPGSGKLQGGKTSLFSRDVDFFSTYYVARDFGLIRK